MLRNKKGLSLAELLIVFIIIGIIASLALVTVKPYEKTFKWLYVRIFHSIETATYNAMMTRTAFPATSGAFCNMLLEFMNSSQNNCAAGDLTINATTFPESNVKIITTNGMRLWIGSNGGAPYIHPGARDGVTTDVKYYIVYADINGTKGPDSTEWAADGRLADIVAFVVTEGSVVIPIGPPEIDTRYMFASTIYPPDDENKPEGTRSVPMSYYAAKQTAWGTSKSDAEIMTLDFYRDFPANSPFSVIYPVSPPTNTTAGCTNAANTISPCYVKIENYN